MDLMLRDGEEAAPPNSAVASVTVFADRALVTRRARAQLPAGESLFRFEALGSGIVEESIKTHVVGTHVVGTEVRVVAATLESRSLWRYRAREHRELWAEARDRAKELCEVVDMRAILAAEGLTVDDLSARSGEALGAVLSDRSVSVARLREALAFLEARSALVTGDLLALAARQRSLELVLDRLDAEIARASALDRREACAVVLALRAPAPCEAELEICYALPGASWRPAYDFHLDPAAGKVRVVYHGEVTQSTGEAWDDAEILLSSAAVELSPAIPALYPLYLSAEPRERTKSVVVEEEEAGDLEAPPGADPGAGDGTGAAATAPEAPAVFRASGRASIPSDGLAHRVTILDAEYAAEAGRECVPAIREFVHLRASLANPTGLPLLEGGCALYRNGDYAGRSALAYKAPGEKIELSFGVDDDLRARRVTMEESYKPAAGLVGKNVFARELRFSVYNYSGGAARVRLREATFVSELKEVTVKIDGKTSPGYELDADGILSWTVDVPPDPAKPAELTLRFTVEAPRSFDLGAALGR